MPALATETDAPKFAVQANVEAVGLLEPEAVRRIEKLIEAMNADKPTGPLVFESAGLGMAAVWAAADRMDFDKESVRGPLALLAKQAASSRRCNRELLRLYDPPAYRAFYTPEGSALQARIARALLEKEVPGDVPTALVKATPEPTLAWLNTQCGDKPSDPELLLGILQAWGTLVSTEHEIQYVPQLQALAARLATNPATTANEKLLLGVINFLRAVQCSEENAQVAAAGWLRHPNSEIREAAAGLLGRQESPIALEALLERFPNESDKQVQIEIAAALGHWSKESRVGAAYLSMFNNSTNDDLRSALITSAATVDWPQRGALMRQAFEPLTGPVLAALSAKPEPELEGKLRELASQFKVEKPIPDLVDALAKARIPGISPMLTRALEVEENLGMRLKLIFGLEKIGDQAAQTALLGLLEESSSELEVEYVVSAVGRLRLTRGIASLSELARNEDAPGGIRVLAIWALGCMPDPRARTELEAIAKHFDNLFKQSESTKLSRDTIFHLRAAKPHLLLALLRTGSSQAAEQIGRLYDESGPLEQTVLLGGLHEQKQDHPVIEKGLNSQEFSVLYYAISAAKSTDNPKYRQRIGQLARAPFIKALFTLGNDAWDLHELLEHP